MRDQGVEQARPTGTWGPGAIHATAGDNRGNERSASTWPGRRIWRSPPSWRSSSTSRSTRCRSSPSTAGSSARTRRSCASWGIRSRSCSRDPLWTSSIRMTLSGRARRWRISRRFTIWLGSRRASSAPTARCDGSNGTCGRCPSGAWCTASPGTRPSAAASRPSCARRGACSMRVATSCCTYSRRSRRRCGVWRRSLLRTSRRPTCSARSRGRSGCFSPPISPG
jgi:hypothetical protein